MARRPCAICGFEIPSLDTTAGGACKECSLRDDVAVAQNAVDKAERLRDESRLALAKANETLSIARTALCSAGEKLEDYLEEQSWRSNHD